MTEAITEGDYGLLNILPTDEEQQLNVGYLGRPKSTVYKVTEVINEEEVWVKEIGKDDCRRIPKRYFNKKALAKATTPHLDQECATSCPRLLTMTEAITVGDYGRLNILLTDEEEEKNVGYLGRSKSFIYKVTKIIDEEELWVKEIGDEEAYTGGFIMDGETIVGYRNYQIPKRYFNKIALKKVVTPHKVDFSKDSDSDKSERKNLKRKISQLENENVQLKKKNTESKTLIKGLREENVRLNQKFLKHIGRSATPLPA